jgi:alkylhydroperoxidase family enzyme
MTEPRIAPVGPEMAEPLKSAMAKVFPLPLPAPALYRTVARNESLFIDLVERRIIGRTGLLDRKTFPSALRELLILRTCVAAHNDYELNLHVKTISEMMGLTKAQIADVQNPVVSEDLWSGKERALVALVDQLVEHIDVAQPVFDEARGHFTDEELVELALLVGLYTSVSMIVALARPEPDPYGA